MTDVKVYGASDDLIEVEGAYLREEFSGGDSPQFLHFNDGTVLEVWYGDGGIWKIRPVKSGSAACSIEIKEQEDADGYSDVASLTGDVSSVECWSSASGPTSDDLEQKIEAWLDGSPMRDVRGHDHERLSALWKAISAIAEGRHG